MWKSKKWFQRRRIEWKTQESKQRNTRVRRQVKVEEEEVEEEVEKRR